MKVWFSPRAEADLIGIHEWIAQDNPATDGVRQAIIEKAWRAATRSSCEASGSHAIGIEFSTRSSPTEIVIRQTARRDWQGAEQE